MAARFESLGRLAARDPELRFSSDSDLGVVSHLRGSLGRAGKDPARAGARFLRDHADLFGDVDLDGLDPVDGVQDPLGTSIVLQQRHAGHRVVGGSVRFHVDPKGELDTVSNRLFPDLAEVPGEARIDARQAVDATREDAASSAGPAGDPELVVVRHDGRPHLAWEVRLETDTSGRDERGDPTRWVAYVDAESARVLVRYNNIQTAGPVVGNGTGYYSGAGTVNSWFDDTTYQLRDTTRTGTGGPEIRTDDEDGAAPSEDTDDDWDVATTVPRDTHQGAEVDAHRYSADVVDYFATVHGRNSFDGAGATLTNIAHVGTDYSNGYWNGSVVSLGDGSGAAPGDDYETSDDWLAHEWTHAYTQYTCGLIYNSESGALNESFSDVFAAFITGDWLVFEDAWLNASAPAWRNMIDPTNGGNWEPADAITSVLAGHQPSHYSERYTGAWDNSGVHVNSGIVNNLFYLLTVGGVHTVSGVAVTGIGQSAAEQMLWRCMTVNLVGLPNATFRQFREAMLDACGDLFPGALDTLAQVKAAFNAVGIGPDVYVRDNLADSGAEPFPGGYLWASPDIINRTAPVADPAVDLADLGDDGLWENVEFGQDNVVYVRLQNRGPESGDATVNVYFSAASTFGTPASWTPIGVLVEAGIAPGTTRVAGPLTFPAASIPAPGHYCMIAVVSSSLDPAPDHTLISSVTQYLDYVRGTNNIAYRNMDVVDAVPGTPGTVEMIVRALGRDVDGYALRLDDRQFVPGAELHVRGPAKVLLAAAPQGLKLVGREGEDAVFRVLAGRERRRDFEFHGLDPLREPPQPGFDRLRIDDEFVLRVDYETPKNGDRRRPPGRPTLAVRQYWKDEPVGGNAIRLRS